MDKRELILHVDLNKTIMMIDPYDCQLTREEVIIDLISNRVWGRVVENVQEIVKEIPIDPEEAKKQQKPDPKQKPGQKLPPVPQFEKVVEKIITHSFEILHDEISFNAPDQTFQNYRAYLNMKYPY